MTFDAEYRDTGTTGLIDLRARMYSPSLGSFLQSDPVGQSPDYTFAAGNPAMRADPSGMWDVCGGVSCGSVWSEMWRNPVSSWIGGPTAAKILPVLVPLLLLGAVALLPVELGGLGISGVAATVIGSGLFGAGMAAGIYGVGVALTEQPFSWDALTYIVVAGTVAGLVSGGAAGMAGDALGEMSLAYRAFSGAVVGGAGGLAGTWAASETVCGRAPSGTTLAVGMWGGAAGGGLGVRYGAPFGETTANGVGQLLGGKVC
jgi:RHS repeat-associated protein